MTTRLYRSFACVALLTALASRHAFAVGADAGGLGGDAAGDAGSTGSSPNDADASMTSSGATPLGCDGGLCTTSTGGTTCSVAKGIGAHAAPLLPVSTALLLAAFAIGRRAQRQKALT